MAKECDYCGDEKTIVLDDMCADCIREQIKTKDENFSKICRLERCTEALFTELGRFPSLQIPFSVAEKLLDLRNALKNIPDLEDD